VDSNAAGVCHVCGKPASTHVTEVRNGKQTAYACCPEHAPDLHFNSEANAMAMFDNNDPETPNKLRAMFGPSQVDQSVRQAIQFCWMMLPDDAKSVDELEKQFRRIVDRAIQDLRDDASAFGLPK
jgi:protein-arginine kinase activator protein McsA